MKRDEFLQALREALHGMKDEEIEGVISYYAELIDDSVEAGMTEEAAVAAMESVPVIASRVLSEAGVEKEEQPKEDENVKVIRRPAEGIHSLHITANSQRVFITSGEDDDITLRYRIDPGDVYRLHEDGGELTLEHKRRPVADFDMDTPLTVDNILDRVSKFISSIDIGGMTILRQPARAIEVTLPRVFRGKVYVSTSNSRVEMENVTCVDEATLNTNNARIALEHVVARRVSATTNNGRVEMTDVYAKNGVSATTSNGRVTGAKVCSDDTINFVTSNGRIEVQGIQAPAIRLHTSNGQITGVIRGTDAEYGLEGIKAEHTTSLVNGEGAQKQFSASTSNGAVTLRFEA